MVLVGVMGGAIPAAPPPAPAPQPYPRALPQVPPLKVIEQHVKPQHPPIGGLLTDNYSHAARVAAETKEREWKGLKDESSVIPHSYRPF